MPQGRFDIRLFDTPGLTDEKLDELLGPRNERSAGALEKLMETWPVAEHVQGENIISEQFAAHMFYFLFQEQLSKINIDDPYDFDNGNAYFGAIHWGQDDAEPTYEMNPRYYNGNYDQGYNIVATGAARRFIEDDIEPHLITSDADGREAIHFRSRWLWLPLNFSSSNIRSIAAWFSNNGDSTGYEARARASRILLKNSAGNPIVLSKNTNQSLYAEYTITLVSV